MPQLLSRHTAAQLLRDNDNSESNYHYNWRCLKYPVRHISLCPQHAQMAESEGETMVCPCSICPGLGFYFELFLLMALWVSIKIEKGVFLIFPVKDIQLAALLQNFKGSNNIHQVSVPSILSGEAKLSMASCLIYFPKIISVLAGDKQRLRLLVFL